MMPIALPVSVIPYFQAAGWSGSTGQSAQGLTVHPAERILQEFSGLEVGGCGAGEECARSNVAFGRDEELEQEPVVQEWQSLLQTTLICLGTVHHFHGALFMDSSGACYKSSLVHDAFSFEGPSFGVAIEHILLGRRGQPMLRPNQDSVSMYGETFKRNHPRVYRYRSAR